jgi:hypothetical protein
MPAKGSRLGILKSLFRGEVFCRRWMSTEAAEGGCAWKFCSGSAVSTGVYKVDVDEEASDGALPPGTDCLLAAGRRVGKCRAHHARTPLFLPVCEAPEFGFCDAALPFRLFGGSWLELSMALA